MGKPVAGFPRPPSQLAEHRFDGLRQLDGQFYRRDQFPGLEAHRQLSAQRHMEDGFIVRRIALVPVPFPVNRIQVQLDVARPEHVPAKFHGGIAEVGSPLPVPPTRLNYLGPLPV